MAVVGANSESTNIQLRPEAIKFHKQHKLKLFSLTARDGTDKDMLEPVKHLLSKFFQVEANELFFDQSSH